MTEPPHFALLHNNTIYLLPPLTAEAHTDLLQNFDSATDILFDSEQIPVVAKVFSPPENFTLEYQTPNETAEPLAVFNDELEIMGWYGSNTINHSGEETYTINWHVNRPVNHEYGAFLQILTHDWERITGKDKLILRWLYPTIAWKPDQFIPDTFTLDIPDNLPTGAYRLVAGAWYVNGDDIPAQSFFGESTENIATIGWLKVPQTDSPEIPDTAFDVDATLNDQFQLLSANFAENNDGEISVTLYWQSLENRPNIDATVFVQALDTEDNIISQSDIRPMNGQYPTFIWDDGEIVATEHILEINDLENIRIIAGMYTQPDFTRLTASQNGKPLPDNLIELGIVSDLLGR